MDRDSTAARIAVIIPMAPGWCRVGLTAPKPELRERACETLAAFVADRLEDGLAVYDPAQLALPLA